MSLERVRELLSPLCPAGDDPVALLVSVDAGSAIAEPLHRMLFAADQRLFPAPRHGAGPLPETLDDLVRILRPVELPQDRLLGLLVATCTLDLAYHVPVGPWDAQQATSVLTEVMSALGPDATWWSNCDFSHAEKWDDRGLPDAVASNPLTHHTFSHAFVGSGNDIVVTILAVGED
ncbi:hypothetical protein [Actinocrispum sp. NPDC049592]|uniref:hypothetical protein n=1 Tax=Actinocrispum sp. NPDC049592 TaxID=3154835 RepID=UPI003423BD75